MDSNVVLNVVTDDGRSGSNFRKSEIRNQLQENLRANLQGWTRFNTPSREEAPTATWKKYGNDVEHRTLEGRLSDIEEEKRTSSQYMTWTERESTWTKTEWESRRTSPTRTRREEFSGKVVPSTRTRSEEDSRRTGSFAIPRDIEDTRTGSTFRTRDTEDTRRNSLNSRAEMPRR